MTKTRSSASFMVAFCWLRRRARRAGDRPRTQPQLACRLLRSWRYAGLRRPLRPSHPSFREGDQPQPLRSPALGVLLVRGARANLRGGLRQSIRVGAESHSASKLSLLALCPPGGCAWAHAAGGGTEDCRRRASAAKAGILVRLCAQAALLRLLQLNAYVEGLRKAGIPE